MASKKKQEEIAKQIDIKKEFADKVYKKMRADRYGLTFCCPNDLEKINVKNYMCNWQDIGYETMPEEYTQNYTTNPIANYCLPPGIYNSVTGLCDAEATQTLVGVTEFTLSDAEPNGTPFEVEPRNDPFFGYDCPIIMESANADGSGNNPTRIDSSPGNDGNWWRGYDATDGGDYDNINNPGVSQTGFANAMAKAPVAGWPASSIYAWAFNINIETTTTFHVALCADHKFGFTSTTAGITTTHVDINNMNSNSLVNMAGAAQTPMWPIEGDGTYDIQTLITVEEGREYLPCNGATTSYFNTFGSNGRTAAARWFIYPLELPAGCSTVTIKGYNKDFDGMLAAVVFQNSKTEIMAADEYSDLTTVFSSDNESFLYQDVDASDPWTCQAPALPISTTPFSEDCPGCRAQTSTMVLQCPDGYVWNENTQICEGTFNTCDTETIMFEVVNQNGEVMPNYEITFDGGSYTTNNEGELSIVIEAASVNTDHMLNLCHCITTGGGCAVQKIKIVVTDPNIETCTPVDEICPCKAPALINTTTTEIPFVSLANITLTFQDLNLSNLSNTIESYLFEWRVYTAAGDGDWTIISVLKPSSGTTFNVTLELSGGVYEYRIKTKCTESESNYAGIYEIDIPTTYGEDLVFWADFSDASSLFTDLAGTANVTNDGDPLRRANNKSTSTKKLGNFVRSVEGLGWSFIDAAAPKWNTTGANGNAYVNMTSTQISGGNINTAYNQPLVSSRIAGFGGVNDGVSFSTLTDLDNHDFTIISVTNVSQQMLENYIPINFLWQLYGVDNGGMTYMYQWNQKPNGSTPLDWYTQMSDGTFIEQIQTPNLALNAAQINIMRGTPNANDNVVGRNEWNVNNTDPGVSYAQVVNPPASVQDTMDFSGGVTDGQNPGINIGAYVSTVGNSSSVGYKGDYYELIMFNKKLTDAELESLVSFLKTKYGIL